jgi:hypothetical protein
MQNMGVLDLVKEERKAGRRIPKVADFELRLLDKPSLELFRTKVVCATQTDSKFVENMTSRPFSSFVSTSDEAFTLFVLKNNEEYLDALVNDGTVELSKRSYVPRWSKIKGSNVKDGGKDGFLVGMWEMFSPAAYYCQISTCSF